MIVKVELRNREFETLEVLDDEFIGLDWEFNRIGGCGSFGFDLPRPYCNEKFISGDFNVRIYGRNPSTNDFDLWYQGIVESKAPNVRGIEEVISVQGHGYQAQLSRIQLRNVSFTNTEISVIVKSILDNHVVPNTDIIYSASDIQATGFTPDSIEFNTDALTAIQTLADIAGPVEWGVDENRSVYFLQESTTPGVYFPMGDKLLSFTSDDSFKDIVNRVIVQGGDIAGVPFRPDPTASAYNDASSQSKYGRRDFIYQNSSIVTDAVAQRFAASVLSERRTVVRRARCELANHDVQIESTLPIPLAEIVARGAFLGERRYGTALYSGKIRYQVNRIVYKLQANDSVLVTNVEMGQPRPAMPEQISQLKHQIEQLRSAGL